MTCSKFLLEFDLGGKRKNIDPKLFEKIKSIFVGRQSIVCFMKPSKGEGLLENRPDILVLDKEYGIILINLTQDELTDISLNQIRMKNKEFYEHVIIKVLGHDELYENVRVNNIIVHTAENYIPEFECENIINLSEISRNCLFFERLIYINDINLLDEKLWIRLIGKFKGFYTLNKEKLFELRECKSKGEIVYIIENMMNEKYKEEHNINYDSLRDECSEYSEHKAKNSFNIVSNLYDGQVIKVDNFKTRDEEMLNLANDIKQNLLEGLKISKEILVITLGEYKKAVAIQKKAGKYLNALRVKFYIPNSINENSFVIDEHCSYMRIDRFWHRGAVTLANVHNVKENTAPMVYIIGNDNCHEEMSNQLKYAITRANCWVSISGVEKL